MASPDILPPPAVPEDRIYVAYHNVRPVLRGAHLVPIQAGRAVSGLRLEGVQGDDTGDNISALNAEYCELTAHYWAWRNGPAQGAVGLMHYRRVLDLSGSINPRGYAERYAVDFDPLAYAGDVAAHFAAGPAQPALVVPRPIRLRMTVAGHYCRLHRAADLDILRQVVGERHPDFLADLDQALCGRRLLLGNMFIMARPIFKDYSQLLFDILPAARVRILARNPAAAEGYQGRYLGFLAERVLTAYALGDRLQAQFPGLCPVHRGIVNTDAEGLAGSGAAGLARLWARGRLPLSLALALWSGQGRGSGAGLGR